MAFFILDDGSRTMFPGASGWTIDGSTNNVDPLTVSFNSGNFLGIKITTPHASGSPLLEITSQAGHRLVHQLDSGSTGAFSGTTTDLDFLLIRNNSATLAIRANGQITVPSTAGTSTVGPQYNLLNDSANAAAFFINGSAASDAHTAGLWQFSNHDMKFGTNNTERVRIGSSGNITVKNNLPLRWEDSGGNPQNVLYITSTNRNVIGYSGFGTDLAASDINLVGMTSSGTVTANPGTTATITVAINGVNRKIQIWS